MDTTNLNSEFGVEEIIGLQPLECASSPDLLVPHFLHEDAREESAERKPKANDNEDDWVPESYLPHTAAPIQPKSINPWPPQLIVELALQLHTLEEILPRYDMSEERYRSLLENPHFRKEIAVMMRELAENGQSFRIKARLQAEAYLDIVDDIVNDLSVGASVRLDAINKMVQWGDLVPKDKKDGNEGAPTVNIQLNF
jgi:hypothetical protein